MDFTIRLAEKEDMSSVHRLITELAVFEKEPNAVEVTVEDLKRDGFGLQPKFTVLVAEQESTIVGIALFYDRFSTWKGRTLHLEDLIVTQSKRGLGVGKALYVELMNYALKNNYKRVAWEVLDWNQGAIDFYESTGASVLKEWRVVHMTHDKLTEFVKK